MNRECGPQCGTCGAIDRINPAKRDDDVLFKSGCQNIVLQRGVAKKLVMGESQLEGVGFGLYVVEPVQKGDYLNEYAGEVNTFSISQSSMSPGCKLKRMRC
jgi:histone-lysine N-methyltransferase EZH2